MKKIRPFISTYYKKNFGQSVEKMKMDMVSFYLLIIRLLLKVFKSNLNWMLKTSRFGPTNRQVFFSLSFGQP